MKLSAGLTIKLRPHTLQFSMCPAPISRCQRMKSQQRTLTACPCPWICWKSIKWLTRANSINRFPSGPMNARSMNLESVRPKTTCSCRFENFQRRPVQVTVVQLIHRDEDCTMNVMLHRGKFHFEEACWNWSRFLVVIIVCKKAEE